MVHLTAEICTHQTLEGFPAGPAVESWLSSSRTAVSMPCVAALAAKASHNGTRIQQQAPRNELDREAMMMAITNRVSRSPTPAAPLPRDFSKGIDITVRRVSSCLTGVR